MVIRGTRRREVLIRPIRGFLALVEPELASFDRSIAMFIHELQHNSPHVVSCLSQSGAVQFNPADSRIPVHCKSRGQVPLKLEGGAFDVIFVAPGREKSFGLAQSNEVPLVLD